MTPTTRPTPFTAALLLIAAFGLLMLDAPPALADEFELGVLLDPDVDEPGGLTFMEGFQLAVDQSPDVSHPSGAEGGDQAAVLAAMGVEVYTVDDLRRYESESAIRAAGKLRTEGRHYVIQEGDVCHFLFNV